MAVEQLEDPLEEARSCACTFGVDRDAATGALRGWLATRGWFAPHALANEAVVDSLAPLYWAGWVVDARITATWTADSNADSRRSAWAPHAGQFVTDCRNLVIPASRGLTLAECGARSCRRTTSGARCRSSRARMRQSGWGSRRLRRWGGARPGCRR